MQSSLFTDRILGLYGIEIWIALNLTSSFHDDVEQVSVRDIHNGIGN